MSVFVQAMIEQTRSLKILVIHRPTYSVNPDRLSCREQTIVVEKLDLEKSVDLFCFLMPQNVICRQRHGISSTDDLANLLYSSSMDPFTKHAKEIYATIGAGNPLNIHRAARDLTSDKLDSLVTLGRLLGTDFTSRAALVKRQNLLQKQLSVSLQAENFKECREIQDLLNELDLQKSDLPELYVLEKQRDDVAFRLELALSRNDWTAADNLKSEITRLDASIRIERGLGSANTTRSLKADMEKTRVQLEARIQRLEQDYDVAFDRLDFEEADRIENQLELQKCKRALLPTKEELYLEIDRLESELKVSKQRRNVEAAKLIHLRKGKITEQLKLEEEAEPKEMPLTPEHSVQHEFGLEMEQASVNAEVPKEVHLNLLLKQQRLKLEISERVKEEALRPSTLKLIMQYKLACRGRNFAGARVVKKKYHAVVKLRQNMPPVDDHRNTVALLEEQIESAIDEMNDDLDERA
ncbi:MAG: hypothetical protein SGARI_000183 [Bacillariaceae sp.]